MIHKQTTVREDTPGAAKTRGNQQCLPETNEGRFVAIVPCAEADRAMGGVMDEPTRVLDMLSGEQLPRIC